ncbi:serine hydrolase domain-containing protein [Maribellus maritimus]|uniref:serine hydrolase domain-containing protein n=1 Tax=Maribellus maritimus TaxID=2870838 RepID=UPI001EECED5B|nr:serine hydrolase domain-containing protein [Maribellus maritimus]MCG6187984.1 beta-lactamase family protein [Maribellus maritimus]
MKILLSIIVVVVSVFCVSGQVLEKKLASVVDKYTSDSLLNGSILVAKKNKILYRGSFGYKNIETRETNRLSTLFPVASLTKQFTSVGILILQQNKKLSIDDFIGKYLEVPESMKNIQIRNLMNHTSGIPDYWQNNIENDEKLIWEFLNLTDALLFQPNTKHSYCNSGYFLLGKIIEKVSGVSYGEFLRKNIFKPVGMKKTFVYDGKNYDRAIGYDEDWNKSDYLMSTGDGGIISTVNDLYAWDKALFENKILTRESKNLMFAPTKLENGCDKYYGLGWDISEENNDVVSHTGNLASFGAYNQYDNTEGYFFVILSNQIRPELIDLLNEVDGVLYKKWQ